MQAPARSRFECGEVRSIWRRDGLAARGGRAPQTIAHEMQGFRAPPLPPCDRGRNNGNRSGVVVVIAVETQQPELRVRCQERFVSMLTKLRKT
jgi:hypothetical protein